MDDVERDARLETWFRAHGDQVLAYLLHRTDRETAQDVLQEVFVTAFRRAEVVPDPPIGWLIATARNTLANSSRSERRRARLTLRLVDDARRPAEAPDADPVVSDALATMSTDDREVLTLSSWYELSAAEAAQALGCSRSAYGVRLHRARRRLAERLRAAGFTIALPARPDAKEAVNE